MIHPLLKLLATKPHLLVDHLEAYAELAAEELGSAATRMKRALVLQIVAGCCLGLGGLFGGIALMLWAVTPPANFQMSWILWAVPVVPCCVAVICLLLARAGKHPSAFETLGQQVRADVAMFREVSAV